MNRREDVLYLTLVDFFLQMLFLVMIALLVYIAAQQQALQRVQKMYSDQREWLDLMKKYEVDSSKELADELSTLAPISEFDKARKALEFMRKHGGDVKVAEMVRKVEEGQGKPPCVYVMNDDKKVPKPVALFQATDNAIVLVRWEPEFQALADKIGVGVLQTESEWGLKAFTRTWSKAVTLSPECRYTVTLKESTRFVEPRDTVQGIFYAQIRR